MQKPLPPGHTFVCLNRSHVTENRDSLRIQSRRHMVFKGFKDVNGLVRKRDVVPLCVILAITFLSFAKNQCTDHSSLVILWLCGGLAPYEFPSASSEHSKHSEPKEAEEGSLLFQGKVQKNFTSTFWVRGHLLGTRTHSHCLCHALPLTEDARTR